VETRTSGSEGGPRKPTGGNADMASRSDPYTHWQLTDSSTVEIINWLDDHSRFLLCSKAYRRVGGSDVINTFTTCVDEHGAPASTLTDNAGVYTSRFVGGRNAFEHLLAQLDVRQKNGHPGTQGKVERFHQTLKSA
jgi:transposase InsO family protein